jgi:acetyltransferase-like isoleucine patch superfamily enzyme
MSDDRVQQSFAELKPVRIAANEKSLGSVSRTLGRYLIPRVVVSLIIYLRDRALVSASSNVQLSKLLRLGKGSVVKPYTIMQTSGGRISFGRNCAIGSFNHIAAGQADIIAGDDVRLGPHVTIVATTRQYRKKDQRIVEQGYADRGIRIGNDVLIGAGAILVDGCQIGDGAVIGVGSIVTGKVAPYSVVFGSPTRVIFWRT